MKVSSAYARKEQKQNLTECTFWCLDSFVQPHLGHSSVFPQVAEDCLFFIDGSILFHECDVIYLPTVVLIDIELIPVWSYYKESYCEHLFPCVISDTGWHFSRIYSLMSSGSRTRQMPSFRTYGKHFKVLKQFILSPKYMLGLVYHFLMNTWNFQDF